MLETEKLDALIEAQGPMGLVLVDEEWQGAVAEQMKALMGGQ